MTTRLDQKLKDRLLDALMDVPGTDERPGRTASLSGIPGPVKGSLNRADNQLIDLTNLVDQLDKLGRLDNGERPIVIMAHNAWRATRGTELGQRLAEIENEIEAAYGGDEPLAELSDEPETLVFGGTGEWVTGAFIEQAQMIGRMVARLVVPRYSGGKLVSQAAGTGTGWLVAHRLLLTSHHVINARDIGQPPASDVDFRWQGVKTKAWFDYHREGQDGAASVDFSEVVTSNRELDYALLRLADSAELADRKQVSLMRERPDLPRGARLNIVQCPGGGPLRYAIRNNFFVGYGDKPYQIRYLTDTLRGSSGAPVLDDNWQAVALHRGFKRVNPDLYKGEAGKSEIVKFHNEGIVIHDILAHLPRTVLQEIKDAQGWE
ncbi:trypsin-like serine peptidase [Rhodococcus sp. NPDC057014]|uniref:trypsin-like serine peptidase n=1 Tax=Rhodococcus sp. NPDC057014 TaxID=3346000 RepID=UPI00362699D8